MYSKKRRKVGRLGQASTGRPGKDLFLVEVYTLVMYGGSSEEKKEEKEGVRVEDTYVYERKGEKIKAKGLSVCVSLAKV